MSRPPLHSADSPIIGNTISAIVGPAGGINTTYIRIEVLSLIMVGLE
jgi:hypothetical protein